MAANFCIKCATPLEIRDIDGTDRKACPNCDFVFWGDFSIGVGALVVKDHKVLLVKRAHDPGRGFWTNPGGYIDHWETMEETVIREVEEEAGIKATIQSVVAIRDLPRTVHNLYLAFSMKYLSGTPTPDGFESDEAGFYSLEEMENMNVAPFTRWLVNIALNSKNEGIIKDKEPIIPLKDHILYKVQ